MPNVSNDLSQKLYATMEKHKEVSGLECSLYEIITMKLNLQRWELRDCVKLVLVGNSLIKKSLWLFKIKIKVFFLNPGFPVMKVLFQRFSLRVTMLCPFTYLFSCIDTL